MGGRGEEASGGKGGRDGGRAHVSAGPVLPSAVSPALAGCDCCAGALYAPFNGATLSKLPPHTHRLRRPDVVRAGPAAASHRGFVSDNNRPLPSTPPPPPPRPEACQWARVAPAVPRRRSAQALARAHMRFDLMDLRRCWPVWAKIHVTHLIHAEHLSSLMGLSSNPWEVASLFSRQRQSINKYTPIHCTNNDPCVSDSRYLFFDRRNGDQNGERGSRQPHLRRGIC